MNKQEIDRLLKEFEEADKAGRSIYLDSDQIEEMLDSLEDAENFDLYDRLLNIGLTLHPGNTALLVKKSKVLMCNEEFEKALTLAQQLDDRENGELNAILINCLFATGQADKARSLLEKLIGDGFEELETVFELTATFLNEMEMHEDAHLIIRRGLKLFPDNRYLKNELCFYLEMESNIPKAIQTCNELVDTAPYSGEHWFTLGRLYALNGEYNKALEAFDFAVTCDKEQDDYELKVLKSYCLYMNGNYEEALLLYQEMATDPELKERIAPLMAECYLQLEKFEESYELMKSVINGPEKFEVSVYLNQIRCCMETGRETESKEVLEKASSLYPSNIHLLSLLSIACMEAGEKEKALRAAGRILRLLNVDKYKSLPESDDDDSQAEAYYRHAQELHRKGDINEAVCYYVEAFKLNPKLKYIYMYLSIAYLQIGELEESVYCIRHLPPEEMQLMMTDTDTYENEKDNLGQNILDLIPTSELIQEYLTNKNNRN